MSMAYCFSRVLKISTVRASDPRRGVPAGMRARGARIRYAPFSRVTEGEEWSYCEVDISDQVNINGRQSNYGCISEFERYDASTDNASPCFYKVPPTPELRKIRRACQKQISINMPLSATTSVSCPHCGPQMGG